MTRPLRQGLTLIEVMVAVAVLALIGVVTIGTLSNTLKTQAILSENDEHQQSVRVAMNKLTHELQLAYLSFNTHTPNTYRTVFISKDENPIDELYFASLSHQRLYRDARESDQTEITVWAEDDPVHEGAYVLMHREAPRIDHEPDKDGVIYPLAYGVTQFTTRWLNHKTCEWQDEWDSTDSETSEQLPRAAQLMLAVLGPDPEDPDNEELVERVYVTTVILQYGKRVRCDVYNDGLEDDEEEDPNDAPTGNSASGGSSGSSGSRSGGLGGGGLLGGGGGLFGGGQ